MDFDRLLKNYKAKACVLSVELLPNGAYGNIRVEAGNRAHCVEMEKLTHHPFVPGSIYETCFPKNPNFEEHCYRCVRDGKPLHAYVELYNMGLWLNMFLMPLESDQDNIGYCIYSYDVTQKVDSSAMSGLSAENASKVLNTCIKLRGSEDLNQTFNEVVEDIRKICDSDHCCILLTDAEKCSCSIFGEALRPGCSLHPMSRYIEGFYAITETWPGTLAGSTCVIVKNEIDMENLRRQNPVWGASLEFAGVKSLVLFPLMHRGSLLGYMWVLNFNVNEVAKIKETLELTTFFIASEIASYQLLNKLEYMSMIDSLTGIKNRNVMNNCVDQIVAKHEPVPVAVLFADLNGLKRMNDERGHSAGDSMLRSAAMILQSVFRDGDVFRAGGDEFMIVIPEIEESEVQKRVARVHELAERSSSGIRFSIGVSYGERDIRRAMRLADERMYAEKYAYYNAHPELKYR